MRALLCFLFTTAAARSRLPTCSRDLECGADLRCAEGQWLARYFAYSGNSTMGPAPAHSRCEEGPLRRPWVRDVESNWTSGFSAPNALPGMHMVVEKCKDDWANPCFAVAWATAVHLPGGKYTFVASGASSVRGWTDTYDAWMDMGSSMDAELFVDGEIISHAGASTPLETIFDWSSAAAGRHTVELHYRQYRGPGAVELRLTRDVGGVPFAWPLRSLRPDACEPAVVRSAAELDDAVRGCASIAALVVQNASDVTDLRALQHLSEIGSLRLEDNGALASLAGLESGVLRDPTPLCNLARTVNSEKLQDHQLSAEVTSAWPQHQKVACDVEEGLARRIPGGLLLLNNPRLCGAPRRVGRFLRGNSPVRSVVRGSECDALLRGSSSLATTVSGRTCQAWSAQSPHAHTVAMSEGVGFGDNHCRAMLDSERGACLWCYTTDPQTLWEYCDASQLGEGGECAWDPLPTIYYGREDGGGGTYHHMDGLLRGFAAHEGDALLAHDIPGCRVNRHFVEEEATLCGAASNSDRPDHIRVADELAPYCDAAFSAAPYAWYDPKALPRSTDHRTGPMWLHSLVEEQLSQLPLSQQCKDAVMRFLCVSIKSQCSFRATSIQFAAPGDSIRFLPCRSDCKLVLCVASGFACCCLAAEWRILPR